MPIEDMEIISAGLAGSGIREDFGKLYVPGFIHARIIPARLKAVLFLLKPELFV
jgi:hypothetical protein